MGTYTLFTIASAAEVGLFGQTFLDGLGAGSVDWLIIALVAMVFVAFLAFGDIRVATRSLLGIEGISVLLIVVLIIVILAKVVGGSAPNDQDFTLDVFSPPGGIPFSTVAIAAVFGFLSFGGFEGAASLGEETDNPSHNIPRAILTAVVAAGTCQALQRVLVAARGPQQRLHRRGLRRRHQLRGDDQCLRGRPWRRQGGLADPLRDLARQLRRRPSPARRAAPAPRPARSSTSTCGASGVRRCWRS